MCESRHPFSPHRNCEHDRQHRDYMYKNIVRIHDLEAGLTIEKVRQEVAISIIREMTQSELITMFGIETLDPRMSFSNFLDKHSKVRSDFNRVREKYAELSCLKHVEVTGRITVRSEDQ